MIHVEPQPEPPAFDDQVRKPGLRALARGTAELPDHWRACLGDLHQRYRGICAYLCVFIPPATGARSVEHFAPKSKHRDLAYEWTNYRLVCSRMNGRKGDFEDVLDPFEIPDGWFALELSFLQVMPSPALDEATRARVQATIDRLRLNDKECTDARALHYQLYLDEELSLERFREWSPFVARAALPRSDEPFAETQPVLPKG